MFGIKGGALTDLWPEDCLNVFAIIQEPNQGGGWDSARCNSQRSPAKE